MSTFRQTAIATSLLALCATPALATTGIWTNNVATSGNWADAKHWENAYVPLADNDSVSFPSERELTREFLSSGLGAGFAVADADASMV